MNKNDLNEYLKKDLDKIGIGRKPRVFLDYYCKYIIALRKHEYYSNYRSGIIRKIKRIYWGYYHQKYGYILGFDIPINVLGPGVHIHHYGCVIINANARIGANCIIQQGVVIGNNGKTDKAPLIGDNVSIGTGAKILGGVVIPDNSVIGANAVVVDSFEEDGIILAGIPAKKIGNIHDKIVT